MRLLRVYGVIVRTFGLFFPGWKSRKLERPVFIVGTPRSGTTFLHRFLVGEGFGAGYQLWGLVMPSLTWRTSLRPMVPRLEGLSPAKFHKNAAHQTSLVQFTMSRRPETVFTAFPDAVILYVVRDPVDAIPSGMSLATGGRKQRFDWSMGQPEVKVRYVRRLYEGMVARYRGFAEAHAAGKLPAKQVVIVRYDRMMADFEGTMTEICDATGFAPDTKVWQTIRETAVKQRRHKSEHTYALAEYGLTVEQIRKDCAFVYETYGITPKQRG